MLEICIDCVASARAAAAGGADRVELCANLPEGGTTPSAGMIRAVRDVFAGGLMVIIRPRGYDFLYSADEMQVMLHEIEAARQLGADGVVIGCLRADGTVDHEANSRLIDAAGPLDITFHRAFDMTRDLNEALDALIGMGIGRVLTSGGKPDVPSGSEMISKLVGQANGRISIMPGGGLTEDNIGEMVRKCGVHEAHLSARHPVTSRMKFINHECFMGSYSRANEYEWRESSAEKIRLAKQGMEAARA